MSYCIKYKTHFSRILLIIKLTKFGILFFVRLPFLTAYLRHPTLLGFYGLKFLCGGHCSANVLQDGEQSAERVKEALVPEGGDQAAAGRGCEGLGYLLAA